MLRVHLRFMIINLVTTALLFLSSMLSWIESEFYQVAHKVFWERGRVHRSLQKPATSRGVA